MSDEPGTFQRGAEDLELIEDVIRWIYDEFDDAAINKLVRDYVIYRAKKHMEQG